MEDSRKRNMERRRETSRYAARDRRAKESDIYDDLKEVVPVVEEPTVTHVDRIALLRVAATVCRYRKNAGNALTNSPMSAEMLRNTSFREQQGMSPWCEDALSECLDGFIIIADSDGVLLYVTESVSIFLGLTQTDFAGRHLKDFCHSDDYKEFLNHTTELTANKTSEESRQCTLRIKSVISPRGRNLNLKSAVYKAISCTLRVLPSPAGHCTLIQAATSPAGQGTVSSTANAMSKNGEAQTGTFMTRHTCDMRISYVSDALNGMLKADSRSLMGASFYELVHPADAESVRKCIQELLQKGHTRTPYYRLVTASGSLAWILTEATTISHTTRGQKGQYIICIHHLLGQQTEEECERGAVEGIAAGFQVCIKKEIDDNEYLGRQPEVMECVEFCPLIGGEADVDAFEPVPAARPPAHANRALPSYARGAAVDQRSRKKSYEDVLQWLFRDQPEGTPPEGSGSRSEWRGGGGGTTGRVGQSHAGAPASAGRYASPAESHVSPREPTLASAQLGHAGYGSGPYGGGAERTDFGGYMLSQSTQSGYAAHGHQQTPSPQHALSSCFSRACDLASSPIGGGCGAVGSAASPLSTSPMERGAGMRGGSAELRPSAAAPRCSAALPAADSLTLSQCNARRDSYGGRADMLSAVSAPYLPGVSAGGPPHGLGPRAYGGGGPLMGPMGQKQNSPHDLAPSSLLEECSPDFAGYAPYIDQDMQPIGGGLPNDLSSLLEFPSWTEAEACPGLPDDPFKAYPMRDSPPAKKGMYNSRPVQQSTSSCMDGLDDWPSWLDNRDNFIDAPPPPCM